MFAEWLPAEQRRLGLEIGLRSATQMKHTMVRTILWFTNNYAGNHLAHHTLEDIKAMEQFFSEVLLDQLTIHAREKIVAYWQQKHQELATVQKYAVHFHKGYG